MCVIISFIDNDMPTTFNELSTYIWYLLSRALKPNMGKVENPQFFPVPENIHTKQFQKKLIEKNLPNVDSRFLYKRKSN